MPVRSRIFYVRTQSISVRYRVICNTLQCLKGRRCAVGCTSDS